MSGKTKRTPKETWLKTGLTLLKTHGPQALSVDRICQIVGLSKGSFYFHFGSIKKFKNHLLAYWEAQHTQVVEDYVAQQTDAVSRRLAVPVIASELDDGVERAIRVWAHTEPNARALISRVDDRRIAFVAQLIAETDQRDLATATELATIEYAAFLGFQHLLGGTTAQDRQVMFQKALCLISPSLAQAPPK